MRSLSIAFQVRDEVQWKLHLNELLAPLNHYPNTQLLQDRVANPGIVHTFFFIC
jgi:hypothetical protein